MQEGRQGTRRVMTPTPPVLRTRAQAATLGPKHNCTHARAPRVQTSLPHHAASEHTWPVDTCKVPQDDDEPMQGIMDSFVAQAAGILGGQFLVLVLAFQCFW